MILFFTKPFLSVFKYYINLVIVHCVGKFVEEPIDKDNPVRFIDAFVDTIDLPQLGFIVSEIKKNVEKKRCRRATPQSISIESKIKKAWGGGLYPFILYHTPPTPIYTISE